MSIITRAKIILDMGFTDWECLIEALKKTGLSFNVKNNSINITDIGLNFSLKKDNSGVYKVSFTIEKMDGKETRKSKEKKDKILKEVQRLHELYDRVVAEKIEKLQQEHLKMTCDELKEQLRSKEEEEIKKAELEIRQRQLEMELMERQKQKEQEINNRINEIKEKAKRLGYQIKEEEVNNEKRLVLVKA